MSTETQHNKEDQQINLMELTKMISEIFEKFQMRIFRGILFLKKNILIIGILFVAGAVLGYFIDTYRKVYDTEIVISPNFGSIDYAYSKTDLIKSKIKDNDTVFLKEVVGLEDPNKLKDIQIEPIIDIYQFVGDKNNANNFELIKLLAEDGDLEKIAKERMTSKNYPFHQITLKTLGQTTDEKTVQPLLNYLNKSDYYNLVKDENIKYVKMRLAQTDSIIVQINGFLNAFYDKVSGNEKNIGDKLVYYNENTQLNEVIKTKQDLIEEQGDLRLRLVDYDKIIKAKSVTLNLRNKKMLNGKLKIILPVLFVGIFLFGGFLMSYYRRQMKKLNS